MREYDTVGAEKPLSVVDKFCFVAPAVELTDFLTDNLGRMLGCDLTHGLEMNLRSGVGHIKQELLGKRAVLNVRQDLLIQAQQGQETAVKMGEMVGYVKEN